MQIDFLANVLGGEGPLHTLLIILALGGMVLAVLIWAMEFSGWTISRHGFVRNNVPVGPAGIDEPEIFQAFAGWEPVSARADSGPPPAGPLGKVLRRWYRLARAP